MANGKKQSQAPCDGMEAKLNGGRIKFVHDSLAFTTQIKLTLLYSIFVSTSSPR